MAYPVSSLTPRTGAPTRAVLLALGVAVASFAPVAAPALAAPVTRSATSIVPGAVNRSSIHLRATYDVIASLNYTAGTLGIWSTMTVTNTSGASIDRLDLNTVVAKLGAIRLRPTTVDGRAVSPRISSQTIYVPLGGVLPAGATTHVKIGYDSRFGTSAGDPGYLFARANGIAEAYRWIPWVSRATTFAGNLNGDPFVTPISPRVSVRITTERAMPIATSGRLTSVSGRTQTFVATNVRDFNFVASPSFQVRTTWAGTTKVLVYAKAGTLGPALLTYAHDALVALDRTIATYPYPTYSVAQTAGGFGLESTGLTWIPGGASRAGLRWLVMHETAHQYFYGVVGNDQVTQPFADEAMADFVSRYLTGKLRSSGCATGRLDGTIYDYSAYCYFEVVYIQGANFLNSTRLRMGSTAFWAAIRDYYASNRYTISTTQRLLAKLQAHTSINLRPSFHAHFPRYYP